MLLNGLLGLPPALLGLILQQSAFTVGQELEWPYNLPKSMKYYPEHEQLFRRNVGIGHKLQSQIPVGLRKMSGDPGEKFMADFWHFETEGNEMESYGNTSIATDFRAAMRVHERVRASRPILPRLLGGTMFEKRDYECPAGSFACSSIGKPDSCCGTGSTCQLIQDVGLGDVGCCPENEVCGGSVSSCPAEGYTSCPQNPGGGCCLPGYACEGYGCIQVSTTVILVTPTPSASSSTSQSATVTTTTVLPPPSSASSTFSSPSPTSPPSTTEQPPNTLICSSGFRSCPASLGGGCCPTDRACGRDVCPELSSTNSFTAPGRPTSNSASTTNVSPTSISSSITPPAPGCPTGFYACSAYYAGGCCQTGRNCDTTSCPSTASITVVDGSTITAVAPTGSGISTARTLLTGSCANGWSTCPVNVGGGCCPSGYGCGTAACSATATGGEDSTIGKIAPNKGRKVKDDSLLAFLVAMVGVVVLGQAM